MEEDKENDELRRKLKVQQEALDKSLTAIEEIKNLIRIRRLDI